MSTSYAAALVLGGRVFRLRRCRDHEAAHAVVAAHLKMPFRHASVMFAPHGFNLPVASPIRAATAFMGREHDTCEPLQGRAGQPMPDVQEIESAAAREAREQKKSA